MSDITTVWVVDQSRGDWLENEAVLQSGNDLATAIYISLFTDRLARAEDVLPDGGQDRRGWWGDSQRDYLIGSRLWLLTRQKEAPAVLLRARDYIKEALQWMIDDSVVASFAIHTEFTRPGMLGIHIIADKDGQSIPIKYEWVWKEIK